MYDVRMVHLEPTQLCQASCPMCDRNKNGGEVNQHLVGASLSVEDVRRIFPKSFVQELKTIYMCGNHGDPILAPDCLEIMEYFRKCNPSINLSITTNGGARKPEWWERLAKIVDVVNFSVDGLEDTNHLYRQGVQWKVVEDNLQAFCDAGGYAKWTFIAFNYNEHQIKEAEQFSKLIGCKEFVVKKSGRYVVSADLKKRETHQAVNRKGELTTLLSQPKNPKYHNKAINKDYDIITKEYGSMDSFIDVAEIKPKCVEKQEIFVSALGHVYPCCWLHGQVYKWWRNPEDSQEYQMIQLTGGLDKINANITPIEQIVNGEFFDEIKNSWNIEGCSNGRLKTCGTKCNVGFDPFRAQWQ